MIHMDLDTTDVVLLVMLLSIGAVMTSLVTALVLLFGGKR